MAGDVGRGGIPRGQRRSHERATTIRKAIAIGALVAVLVGAGSSLATARLTDRQPALDDQRAEIAQLSSQNSELEAQIARLTSQTDESGDAAGEDAAGEDAAGDDADRLNAEIADLEDQLNAMESQNTAFEERVQTLEGENATLQDQLSQLLNPAPGPAATAQLTVNWVQPICGYGDDGFGVITYGPCTDVIVCVTIENTTQGAAEIYYTYGQFAGVDRDFFSYSPRPPNYDHLTPLVSGVLGPGEKARGQLLYPVPVASVETTIPASLSRLVWNVGLAEMSQIEVDLPAPDQVRITSSQSC